VDEHGKRSGPSEFAEAPRPILYSRPVTDAKVGSDYRYSLLAIRSFGDLRTRVVNGKETMNYWDLETPQFALTEGPPWLTVDKDTGVLSGVPNSSGKFTVVVTVTIDQQVRNLDAEKLSWGIEKVLSTSTKRVGAATQKFTIDVTK
jgi:hypothetical protein